MENYKLITLEKVLDNRGNLSFIEEQKEIPFDIKRCYWIYDVPGGEKRGGHAFRKQEEIIIALSGSFEVSIFDGKEETVISLNRSYQALYIKNMVWRQMQNFSTNSVALVISSTEFSLNDYIYDKSEFLKELHHEAQDSI